MLHFTHFCCNFTFFHCYLKTLPGYNVMLMIRCTKDYKKLSEKWLIKNIYFSFSFWCKYWFKNVFVLLHLFQFSFRSLQIVKNLIRSKLVVFCHNFDYFILLCPLLFSFTSIFCPTCCIKIVSFLLLLRHTVLTKKIFIFILL